MAAALEDFFDEDYYALSREARKKGMRPIDHYLDVGEALGYAPSERFDPKYYADKYPDLASFKGSLLFHYANFGILEGRSPCGEPLEIIFSKAGLKRNRATILMVGHEATRTGAPILAWNLISRLSADFNVVTVLMKGGPIEAELNDVSSVLVKLPNNLLDDNNGMRALRKVVSVFAPKYAIANSSATQEVAVMLEDLDVPVIALVHEFSSDRYLTGGLHELYSRASKLVFSARIVAAASEQDYDVLRARQYVISPQGSCKLPLLRSGQEVGESRAGREVLKQLDRDLFVVVGMGTVTYRKGVDTFISVAAELLRKRPSNKFRFIWVGHVYPFDVRYKTFLQQQILRSGLEGRVILMDEVTDLDPLYKRADAFLLASRLDPLPNVAIDAALKAVPIVCFENASGIAEILADSKDTSDLVVPYLDTGAAARVIMRLSEDRKYFNAMSRAIRIKARKTFRMPRYLKLLRDLGQRCLEEKKQGLRDQRVILKAGVFDPVLCFGPDKNERSPAESVSRYLKQSRLAWPLERPRTGLLFRRPMVGFNPLIYASDNPEFRRSDEDPLAHFLRSGRPAGRWSHQVIVPTKAPIRQPGALRVALHGHYHYPELIDEFLERVLQNKARIDLFLTTTGPQQAQVIKKSVRKFGIKNAEIFVVSNRGRDIGPFLRMFRAHEGVYDVIGHMHGKRSAHVAIEVRERWRDFMLQHLLGGSHSMADIILDQFANDPTLGLVFPEDPHLNDWDKNRPIAETLARRMKIRRPLPTHFDFPMGTMFWARPKALRPMFDLNLTQKDYPDEPLPIDGTILHALERLVPFAAEKSGYRHATTHVPGSMR
jgi:hypothetical protein